MMSKYPYPEHQKLVAADEKRKDLVRFLTWLKEQGVELASFNHNIGRYIPHFEIEDDSVLLARYLGIDIAAYRKETALMAEVTRAE